MSTTQFTARKLISKTCTADSVYYYTHTDVLIRITHLEFLEEDQTFLRKQYFFLDVVLSNVTPPYEYNTCQLHHW